MLATTLIKVDLPIQFSGKIDASENKMEIKYGTVSYFRAMFSRLTISTKHAVAGLTYHFP